MCERLRLLGETKAFLIAAPVPSGDGTLFSRWLYLPPKQVVLAFRGSHYLVPCFYCCLVLSRPSHCCKESGRRPGSTSWRPRSRAPRAPRGAVSQLLYSQGILASQRCFQVSCLLPLGSDRALVFVEMRSEFLGGFPERKADSSLTEVKGHVQPSRWMPQLFFRPRT